MTRCPRTVQSHSGILIDEAILDSLTDHDHDHFNHPGADLFKIFTCRQNSPSTLSEFPGSAPATHGRLPVLIYSVSMYLSLGELISHLQNKPYQGPVIIYFGGGVEEKCVFFRNKIPGPPLTLRVFVKAPLQLGDQI